MPRNYGFQACDYIKGNNTEVWIGQDLLTCAAPKATEHAFAVSAQVAAQETSITLAAPLVADMKKFETMYWYNPTGGTLVKAVLTADVAKGQTVLPVEPLPLSLSAVHTANRIATVPLFSYNNVGLSNSGESIEPRAIGAGEWATKLMTKRTASVAIGGPEIQNDPGRRIIEKAALSIEDRVYVHIIKPSGDLWSAYAWIESTNNTMNQDDFVAWEYTITVDGAPWQAFVEDLAAKPSQVF